MEARKTRFLVWKKKIEAEKPTKEQGICRSPKQDQASQSWACARPRLVSASVKTIEIPANAVQVDERGNREANPH
jgi:hypothetical protein